MTISLYQVSVPVFSTTLKNLGHVLSRGEAFAAANGLSPEDLLSSRLAPDMLPLTSQVQIATDHAKGACARLAGHEIMGIEDRETTFADLQARIAAVREHLNSYRPEEIDGAEERPVEIRAGRLELSFTGQQYLLHYAMPNFYFHVVTAYDILRHRGVPIGKGDFFGRG